MRTIECLPYTRLQHPLQGSYFQICTANLQCASRKLFSGGGVRNIFKKEKSHPCRPSCLGFAPPSEEGAPLFSYPCSLLTPLLPRLHSDVGLPSRPRAGWMPPVLGIRDFSLPWSKKRLPLRSLRLTNVLIEFSCIYAQNPYHLALPVSALR